MVLVRFKRGTRAELDTAASAGSLNLGEPYLVTDEAAAAVGAGASTYVNAVVSTEVTHIVQMTQAEYDAISTPDATTVYLIGG